MHPPEVAEVERGIAAKYPSHGQAVGPLRDRKGGEARRPPPQPPRNFHRSTDRNHKYDTPQSRRLKNPLPYENDMSPDKFRAALGCAKTPESIEGLPFPYPIASSPPRQSSFQSRHLPLQPAGKRTGARLTPVHHEKYRRRPAAERVIQGGVPCCATNGPSDLAARKRSAPNERGADSRIKAKDRDPTPGPMPQNVHGLVGAIGHDRAKLFSSFYRRSRRKESKGEVTSAQGTGAFREEPCKNRLAPRGTEHGGKPGQPNRRRRLPRSGKDRRGKNEKNLARATTPRTTRRSPAAETGGKVVMHPAGHGGEGPPRESRLQAGFCHRRGERDQLRNLTERALHPRRPGLQPGVRETGERANPPHQRWERIRTGSFLIHFGKYRKGVVHSTLDPFPSSHLPWWGIIRRGLVHVGIRGREAFVGTGHILVTLVLLFVIPLFPG